MFSQRMGMGIWEEIKSDFELELWASVDSVFLFYF
jgi:hypothetical protein